MTKLLTRIGYTIMQPCQRCRRNTPHTCRDQGLDEVFRCVVCGWTFCKRVR